MLNRDFKKMPNESIAKRKRLDKLLNKQADQFKNDHQENLKIDKVADEDKPATEAEATDLNPE